MESAAERTSFADKLYGLCLLNQPPPESAANLADQLLCLRFPFGLESIGEDFIGKVRQTLSDLPVILLQILQRRQIFVELDYICEIAAILDQERCRLYVSKRFMLDDQVFETESNPIFPYGLRGVILHELAHLLDWNLYKGGRISGLPTFQNAFRDDVSHIPPEMRLNHMARIEICELHGGYVKLPEAEKERCDLALFTLQDEETFADIFALLMTGRARAPVEKYFPRSVDAARQMLEYYLGLVSRPYP